MDEKISKDIWGVSKSSLNSEPDSEGSYLKIWREDESGHQPAMMYLNSTKKGSIRGPHEHREQTDILLFVGPGDVELHLWDNRPMSRTYKNHMKILAGISNPFKIIVPHGVVHAYKTVSEEDALCINIPDRLYMGVYEEGVVDKISHKGKDSPFQIF